MSDLATTTTNSDLAELGKLLQTHRDRAVDVVAPAAAIHAEDGYLHIPDAMAPVLTEHGVTTGHARWRPNGIATAGLADKLRIPAAYLRRLATEHLPLFDDNINGWLECDRRKFLIRGLCGDDGTGVCRAVLSDSYKIVDNLDVLTAVLDGITKAGIEARVAGADLTESRMSVRIEAPAIRQAAPELLGDYRSPFTGAKGADNPIIFAGFVVTNSEVGAGAFTITPRVTAEVCRNGMTISKDAHKAVHLGGKLDEGNIAWSDETQARNIDLVTSQARDAVTTFCTSDYLARTIDGIACKAGVEVRDPETTVTRVAAALRYSDSQRDAILNHFLRGADPTAGGVMHAVTSTARAVRDTDADTAHEMESHALRALEVAAAA
jgi:hypothetical protein